MIVIDHHNGYQTRYLHMQKDGLITNIPGQKVEVTARQPIGKVGATGNVSPPGDAGAHIHFGVFQDKNNDGNFDDNIPDGVTDPFGWQSKDPDPWETFAFNYGGKNRTGNKSFYLWKNKLDNLDSSLTSNGGVFKIERANLDFPQGTVNQNLNLNIKSAPFIRISPILESIGSTLVATAKDPIGNLIKTFQSFYTLTIDFSNFDLTKYKTDTISIYSSEDGINWTKETTQVDLNSKTASSLLNHMTYFALMAERIDTTPPVTNASLSGDEGRDNWFRSDVTVTLRPEDSEQGLGVDYTMFKVDDQDWEIYSNAMKFTSEGHHKIEFYSADKDENLEEIKKIEFDIDKTLPEVKIYVDQTVRDLVVQGLDQNLDKVDKQDNTNTGRADDAFYIISDLAGNNLKLDVRNWDKEQKDRFRISSISYNNQLKALEKNYYNIRYKDNNDSLIVDEQTFSLEDDTKIKIKYDSDKNQSSIKIKDSGEEKIKDSLDGLVILQLITNKGNLEYSY